MKLSPRLCADIVALATLALTTDGAFAGKTIAVPFGNGTYHPKPPHQAKDSRVNSELENVDSPQPQGMQTTPRSSGHPKKQFQSTTVNTSRSNIKNNLAVDSNNGHSTERMGGGGGGRTK